MSIRGDVTEEFKCKMECWMSTEYNERVLDYLRLTIRDYIVKKKQFDVLECESDLKNTMPDHLDFILGNSERIMEKKHVKLVGVKRVHYVTAIRIVHILRKSMVIQ